VARVASDNVGSGDGEFIVNTVATPVVGAVMGTTGISC